MLLVGGAQRRSCWCWSARPSSAASPRRSTGWCGFVRDARLAAERRRAPRSATTRSARWPRRSTGCSTASSSRRTRWSGRRSSALAGLFAARVAHDIRNPLSSIKMQTQLLQVDGSAHDTDDREALTAVLHDIDQVESVMRDLLELASPGELTLRPVDLNDGGSRRARPAGRAVRAPQDRRATRQLADGPAAGRARSRRGSSRRCCNVLVNGVRGDAHGRRHDRVDRSRRRRDAVGPSLRRWVGVDPAMLDGCSIRSCPPSATASAWVWSTPRPSSKATAAASPRPRAAARARARHLGCRCDDPWLTSSSSTTTSRSRPRSSASCGTKGTRAVLPATPRTRCAWSAKRGPTWCSWTSGCRASTACRRCKHCAAAIPRSTS